MWYKISQNTNSLRCFVLVWSASQYKACHRFRAGTSVHKFFVGGVSLSKPMVGDTLLRNYCFETGRSAIIDQENIFNKSHFQTIPQNMQWGFGAMFDLNIMYAPFTLYMVFIELLIRMFMFLIIMCWYILEIPIFHISIPIWYIVWLGKNLVCLLHYVLTHWGRVTHICVSKLTNTGSDNAGILLNEPLGTNFSEILIGIQIFSFRKMRLKMSSAKGRLFCLGLNVLTTGPRNS